MTTMESGSADGNGSGKSGWRNVSILKPALVVLAIALCVFGYTLFKSLYIPAYGDKPEELAYLDKVDKRALLGGDMTHFKFGAGGFSEPAFNLPWQAEKLFDDGDGVFERAFRPASKNSQGSDADGLGPIYNNTFCEGCHELDGRTTPVPGGSFLVRLSVPGTDEHGGPKAHPVYGGQFGDVAIPGVKPEGTVEIDYEEIPGEYGDGTPYSLRKPTLRLVDLNYGPLGEETMMSPRGAPSVFGLGLLEAIPEATLRGWADPEDKDGDGISGRLNIVWDTAEQKMAVGRFGWKAEQPTLINQVADAASNDMGVTSPVLPHSTCTEAQADCRRAIDGSHPEGSEYSKNQIRDLVAYLEFLSVPARGHLDDADVLRGEKLFAATGCTGCHKPTAVTGDDHERRRLRNQNIQPFTDLLLHDMGEGLADNRPSFQANGREWRTAPLWGVGLVETVNGHTNFLHDGRARNLEEAILWHGGEAEAAKEGFRTMSADDREALVKFLKSL